MAKQYRELTAAQLAAAGFDKNGNHKPGRNWDDDLDKLVRIAEGARKSRVQRVAAETFSEVDELMLVGWNGKVPRCQVMEDDDRAIAPRQAREYIVAHST